MKPDDAILSRLSAAFRRDPEAFLFEPLQLRWWVHGGEPGSPSNAVTIAGANGVFNAICHRIRFDFALQPPQQVEELVQPVSIDAVKNLLAVMLSSLFGTRFAEEDSQAMADAQQESWTLQRGTHTLSKTFYEPFPPGLSELRDGFAACVRGR